MSDLGRLVTELQVKGLRAEPLNGNQGRRGGAGPSDHRSMTAPLKGLVQRRIRRDRREILGVQPPGGADHEAAGLQGVVSHGHRGLFGEDRTDE